MGVERTMDKSTITSTNQFIVTNADPIVDDDIEIGDATCPKCNHYLYWQRCPNCEDGFIDLYDEDPLWYDEDEVETCPECGGHGCHSWCPNCGWDVIQKRYLNGKAE